ncbi:ankyrin repeat domain-containing protein [Pseudoxanthomonas winnipegensis]|nr:ankyrin repeat domain-containing protein [Pseudoxanthomonas winnipegensis]
MKTYHLYGAYDHSPSDFSQLSQTTINALIEEKDHLKYDRQDCTALHYAAHHGDYNLIRQLIDAGAPVNDMSKAMFSPLHHAVDQGHLGCAALLLSYGADPHLSASQNYHPSHPMTAQAGSDFYKSPLDLVAETHGKQEDMYKVFREAGVDISQSAPVRRKERALVM